MLKIFVFIDIWFMKQDIQKWLKTKICSFYEEFENEQKKKDENFLIFQSGDLDPRFSEIFRSMIWSFLWFEEPKIKSKQASKRDRTLKNNNPSWFKLNYCASTRAYGLANFPSAVQEAGQSTNTVKYILEDLLLLFDHQLSLLWSKKTLIEIK